MKKPSSVEQNWLPELTSRQWKPLISCSKSLSVYKGRKAISEIGKVSLAIAAASVNTSLFTELICAAQVFPRHLYSHVILFPPRTYPCHNLNAYLCFCIRDSSARSRTAMSEHQFHRGQTSRACSVSVMLAGAATGWERRTGTEFQARPGTARGRPRSAFGRGCAGDARGCAGDAGGWTGRESGFVDLNNKWPTKFYLLICSIINNALWKILVLLKLFFLIARLFSIFKTTKKHI